MLEHCLIVVSYVDFTLLGYTLFALCFMTVIWVVICFVARFVGSCV